MKEDGTQMTSFQVSDLAGFIINQILKICIYKTIAEFSILAIAAYK